MTRPRLGLHRIVLPAFLLAVASALIYSDVLVRVDQLLYDSFMQSWPDEPDPRIVIVAIDEQSLRRFGRWPWPRHLHADLIRQLKQHGASVIAMDLVFAEPDRQHRENDRRLAQSIKEANSVVLPILLEQPRLNGPLVETLPLPELVNAGARLGHVHIELDSDGIARSAYLKEGLSVARWPHFALVTANAHSGYEHRIQGQRGVEPPRLSPFVVARDHHLRFPFYGPPGTFPRLSYEQILSGNFDSRVIAKKIVLIGVTATGLGDALPTPVSGFGRPMPGVEIHANLLSALLNEQFIAPLSATQRWVSAAIVLILLCAYYFVSSPRGAFFTTGLLAVTILAASALLLYIQGVWYAPAALIASVISAYPLWSWQRLEFTTRYLNSELERLRLEPGFSNTETRGKTESALTFFEKFLPICGACVIDHNGNRIRWGKAMRPLTSSSRPDWIEKDGEYWCSKSYGLQTLHLGFSWQGTEPPSSQEFELIEQALLLNSEPHAPPPRGAIEVVERRVDDVQSAIARIRDLRRFIADSLAQLAHGVVMVSRHGHVLVCNDQARAYLAVTRGECIGQNFLNLSEGLVLLGEHTWTTSLRRVVVLGETIQCEAVTPQDRDLYVQLSPLTIDTERQGFIVSLADVSALKASERQRTETLGFLSHDLRTPLVSMLALLEFGTGKATIDPNTIAKLKTYAHRTLTLAEDFLQLARAESGPVVSAEESDLNMIAANSMDQVFAQAEQRQMTIIENFTSSQVPVFVDAHMLERAISNLLVNAIKYCPPGAQIRVNVGIRGSKAFCSVIDDGPGIPADDLPRLFERFYRRNVDGGDSGAGLGLAFVKAVVQRFHGELRVFSRIGEGAQFRLELPLVSED